jgi:hypothetical protein
VVGKQGSSNVLVQDASNEVGVSWVGKLAGDGFSLRSGLIDTSRFLVIQF